MRPQRQAARDALSKIRSIREWENLSENSERFRELAQRIDDELRTEIEHRHVDPGDVDMSEEQSSEESEDEHDSFVASTDDEMHAQDDTDFVLSTDDMQQLESMESMDSTDSMVSVHTVNSDTVASDTMSTENDSSDAESLQHTTSAALDSAPRSDAEHTETHSVNFCNTVFLGT